MGKRIKTQADEKVRECLIASHSFALIAGAGSGKTSSLIDALDFIHKSHGPGLRQNGQRVACITYTKRAAEVIKSRLGFDGLFVVSTLHSFLWSEFGRFQRDIREALRASRIPDLIAKAREKDNGGASKQARRAREQVAELESQLADLNGVAAFRYENAIYSNYRNGDLSHDDIVALASYLLAEKGTFRRILGLRYPYIFVDEAQDTFDGIVAGLNVTCAGDGLPLVGYFGDPWQQIYEGRVGMFAPPAGCISITKTENFRCSKSVIRLLNAFRTDVEQYAAGDNSEREGSVRLRLVQSEEPALPRKRYSNDQVERALARMDQALADWTWNARQDVVRLFLARQMIARRLGFSNINQLFTGKFASSRAQEDYESGEHFLLKPLITTIWPLVTAYEKKDTRRIVDLLRLESPDFAMNGPNKDRSLREMIDKSNGAMAGLHDSWTSGTVRDILAYCRDNGLLRFSDRLADAFDRAPRAEEYDEDVHSVDKGDWLSDAFLAMKTDELPAYCDFVTNNTAYSTQHGVKGEEYPNVLVVFDDVEAEWNNYSFTKLLTPSTSGEPTEGQRERGRKLAYVCFSRALDNLRILLFTPNPNAARKELLKQKLLNAEQIEVIQ